MISLSSKNLRLLAFTCFMTLISSCSTLNRLPPAERAPAQRDASSALQKISLINSKLVSFKGIGHMRLSEAKQPTLSERVAWVGSLPNKLAIVVLVSGRPIVKIASDGHYLYTVDLQDTNGSYRKIKTADPRLERIIRIPATVSDIATVLAGRIPIRQHSRAFLQNEPSSDEVILVLEKWWSVIQKIYLSKDDLSVQRFEIFGRNGSLLYRYEITETQIIQGYRVPIRLRFSDDNGTVLQLEIERYVADVEVRPDMFILIPPDSTTP